MDAMNPAMQCGLNYIGQVKAELSAYDRDGVIHNEDVMREVALKAFLMGWGLSQDFSDKPTFEPGVN